MKEGCDAKQKRNGWGGPRALGAGRKEGGSQREKKMAGAVDCSKVKAVKTENRRKIDDDERGERRRGESFARASRVCGRENNVLVC